MRKKHLLDKFKHRRQDVLVLTGFRGMVDDSLDEIEDKGCAANDRLRQAWDVDEPNQFIDRETGRPTQLILGWSPAPVKIFDNSTKSMSKNKIEAISCQVTDEEITWEQVRQHRNMVTMWSAIIAFILALGIVIPVLKQVFEGGVRIPLPFFS